jgi:hypothetical protein
LHEGVIDGGEKNGNAPALGFFDIGGNVIETGAGTAHGGEEFGGVMGFEIGHAIGDVRVSGGVGFAEAEAGEFFDHQPSFFAFRASEADLFGGLEEFGAKALAFALSGKFCGGTADEIGFGERHAADGLSDLHDLLLIDADAESIAENFFEGFVGVMNGLLAAKTLEKKLLGTVFRSAGTDERERGGDFLERAGFHGAQETAHPGGFDLENAHGATGGDDVASSGIVFGDGVEIDLAGGGAGSGAIGGDSCGLFWRAVDVVESEGHGGEAALAEKIHLDEAEGFDGVHVILRDDDAFGSTLERNELRERTRGDDCAAGMNAEMARSVVKTQSDLKDGFPRLVVDGKIAAFGKILDGLKNFAHRTIGKTAGEAIDFSGRDAKGFCDFADGKASVHGDETADHRDSGPLPGLRNVRLAPFGVDVIEEFVATGAADVNVNIGTIAALSVQETFEIEAPTQWANARNAEAVRDDGTGGGAASYGGNAAAAGFFDDVPDKKKIGSEIEFFDDFEFVSEAGKNFRTQRAIEAASAFKAEFPEIRKRRFAIGNREFGEDELV